MTETVEFELVTPQRLLLSMSVDMVVLPGGEGDFGVLPGHAPMISTVRPGVVNIYEGNRISQSIFVNGGFAEVNGKRCTLLAGHAVDVRDIKRNEADDRLAAANDMLKAAEPNSLEAEKASAEIKIAQAMIAAMEKV